MFIKLRYVESYDEEGFDKETIKLVPTGDGGAGGAGMLHRPGLQAAAGWLQNLEGIQSLDSITHTLQCL